MAERIVEFIWRKGWEKLLINDAEIRELTAEETAARKQNKDTPFIGEEKEWLDCTWVRGAKYLENHCVKIIKRLSKGE